MKTEADVPLPIREARKMKHLMTPCDLEKIKEHYSEANGFDIPEINSLIAEVEALREQSFMCDLHKWRKGLDNPNDPKSLGGEGQPICPWCERLSNHALRAKLERAKEVIREGSKKSAFFFKEAITELETP